MGNGISAQTQSLSSGFGMPPNVTDILSLNTGAAQIKFDTSKSRLSIAAFVDNLTSYGAMFWTPHNHTLVTESIRAGAIAATGTVSEPTNNASYFPSPKMFVNYLSGMTIGEALYARTSLPNMLLLVGDPLARPFKSTTTNPPNPPTFVAGCKITQNTCPFSPQKIGTFTDSHDGSSTNEGRCLRRAAEFSEWCNNPRGVVTSAEFTRANGTKATTSVTSTGCFVVQYVCTNYPNFVGVILDDHQGSGTNESRCLTRASDYANWCNNPRGAETRAKFIRTNGSVATRSYVK
jgi:hypothetical protein